VGVGFNAGGSISTGLYNTFLGALTGDSLNDADYNVAVGYGALTTDTKGSRSTAIGYNALSTQNLTSSSDSNNTAVGYNAGSSITAGTLNTIVGASAGDALQNSGLNTLIGQDAGTAMDAGKNTCIGQQSGSLITSGASNTIIGRYNGNSNNVDIRTSNKNVVLSDGDGNVLYHIDSNAQHNPYRGSSSSNDNIISFRSNVNGTRNSNCNIQADGDIFNLGGTYGQISDETLKENIVDANSQWNDIKALQIRNFSWKVNNLDAPNQIGVIAQEVQKSGMNGLIKEQQDGTLGVKYSILYTKAVKALQEAMTRIETLEADVKALKGE
jgi:hypothetical protein